MNKHARLLPQAVDGLETLHQLLGEVRLLAGLVVSMKPQTLMVESEHLATMLVSFASRLEAAIRMIPEPMDVTRTLHATHRR